ncbi:hypothetical protein QTP86_026784, partial [Hemibagrus guttatus]
MKDGELTEDEVSKHLSDLGRSATGLQHVYLSLSVPRKSLKNVSILSTYIHIQKLELPHNKIKDLSCVSHMPYLIKLDASHNEIFDFFGFQPPKNLKEVDFSHNRISSMKDLSAYTSLRKLILGFVNLDQVLHWLDNFISEIRGLEKCSSLTHLSMEHNKILCISGLRNLPLRQLCLKGNLIKRIENLQTLRSLQILDLSSNRIQSLSGLQDLHLLGNINLESNMIGEIKECTHVQYLLLLRELNLKRNPIQEQPDYRLAVIFILNHLTVMDEQPVTVEEKVSAVNKYDPSLELVAARDHMTHVMYQHIQPQGIFDSTLPSLDTPYPMLVLTGPQACGKRELAHKLCHEYSDYFGYGTCHTTRGPYFGEEDGCDYHFVQNEEFQNMIRMGYFVQTMQYGGNWYGLSRESIESVAREGLACCVHMELEGVFSLKASYFEPRYILLIPTKTEDYISHMKARGFYTDAQIEKAMSRIDLYAKINRERPGFFDSVILCDDRKQAYSALKQLIKEYLGLEEQEKEGGRSTRGTPQNTTAGAAPDAPNPSPSQKVRSSDGSWGGARNVERPVGGARSRARHLGGEREAKARRVGGSEDQGEASGGNEDQGEASGGNEDQGEASGGNEDQGEASGGNEDQGEASGGSEKPERDKWGEQRTRRQGQRVRQNVHNRAEAPNDVHSRAAEPSDVHSRAAAPSDVHSRAAAPSDVHRRALAPSDVHRRTTAPWRRCPSRWGLELPKGREGGSKVQLILSSADNRWGSAPTEATSWGNAPHRNMDEGGESTAAKKIEANPTDAYSQNYYSKVQARLLPQKTSAELASIHRRQQMVREALVGKIPRAYTHLFKRYVHTSPSLLTPYSQSCDHNEDSSSEESCASSGLSMNSSAGVRSVGSPAEGLDAGSGQK